LKYNKKNAKEKLRSFLRKFRFLKKNLSLVFKKCSQNFGKLFFYFVLIPSAKTGSKIKKNAKSIIFDSYLKMILKYKTFGDKWKYALDQSTQIWKNK